MESELDTSTRQCFEDYLLYLHRIEFGQSTLANHGRLHPRWTRPSNKGQQKAAERLDEARSYPSIAPAVGGDDFHANNWLGLDWTVFEKLCDAKAPPISGVYRIRHRREILYFGESQSLQDRIRAHSKDDRFAGGEVSFHLMPEAFSHQLKERECDLIGAYFSSTGLGPLKQYRPRKGS